MAFSPETYALLIRKLLAKSGGTMTGALDMDGNAITGLPQTTDSDAAVSFGQVQTMIEAVAGIYRGAFATYAALIAVQWQTTDPTAANYVTNNDWAVVLADETHSGACWRYGYTVGVGWQAQFKINDTPLSQAQIDALNSGITAAILTGIINSLAPAYDDTAAYSVGDFCTHDGQFYVCSTAIPTGGETWNAAHWTATSLADAFAALADKAPLASPAFTGTPTAPTPSASDNSTKLATTAFVQSAVSGAITDAIGGSY